MKLQIPWIVCLILMAGFFVSPAPAVIVRGDTGTVPGGVYGLALSRPTALAPGTGTEPGPELGTLSPALTWKAVTGAEDYTVFVSKYPYGSANIIWSKGSIYGTSVTIPQGVLVHSGKYRWNLQARSGTTWSSVSNTLYFQTPPFRAPVALSPGSASSPGTRLTTLTPTLTWTAPVGAENYSVAISRYPYGSANIVWNPQGITGTSLTVPAGVLSSGTNYRWNLQARAGTRWSPVSSTLYFQGPLAGSLPQVTTKGTGSVASTTARLEGTLVSTGGFPCTVGFEYWTGSASPTATARVTMSAPGSFGVDLKGLPPATTYQFRAVAENPKGKVTGTTLSFTTAPQAYLEGIDVSVYQRSIDWTKVAAAGKSFALIRSSYGDVKTDSTFLTNIRGASAAGVRAGPYHCKGFGLTSSTSDAAVIADAKSEAAYFLAVAGDCIRDGYLRPVLDVEQEDARAMGSAKLNLWVTTWISEVRAKTGVEPFIYTSQSVAQSFLNAENRASARWIARWGGTEPSVGWDFWQYSSTGTVSGVQGTGAGYVDLDRFRSDMARLDAEYVI
ncbi:MAG: glycoside hydrolase family 25 [Methanomicrobia archaeon]|nr:glycoside hydrolase family 25 [Methanomicrobia archaeon]